MVTFLLAANAAHRGSVDPVSVEGRLCHPTQLIVRSATPEANLRVAGVRGEVVRRFPEIGWSVIRVEEGQLTRAKSVIDAKFGPGQVFYDRVKVPAYTPNDPLWPDMWHATAIKADLAWDVTFGSPSATVAIIDTGVNTAHEDLAANMWVNTAEIPGNNIDDDSNGYIDDINGWDFAYNDAVPNDVHGHGTACAGLAAGVQDNNLGGTGVAPRAKIMALKAAIDSGYFYDSANIGCYLYAAANGASVVSCSFFSDLVTPPEEDAINYIFDHGVLPVVAAANASSVIPYYPAAYEKSLAVAAFQNNGNMAGFSNFGSWVDVAAPGTNLRTTTNSGGYTNGFGGTSGATPQVAGLAALLKGMNPALTPQQIRNVIEDSALLVSQAPMGEYSNYGKVDCLAAVQTAQGATPAVKPVKVRWAMPMGRGNRTVRIYGRGMDRASVTATDGAGGALTILERTRDYMDVRYFYTLNPLVKVYDGATLLKTLNMAIDTRFWTLAEASAPSASVTGGFDEVLTQDSTFLTCTRRSDGKVILDGVIKLVDKPRGMQISLNRRYLGATAGTETVSFYKWSTNSYPYGSYETIGTSTINGNWQFSRYQLPNASNFYDVTGSLYIRIETTADLPTGTVLQLDLVRAAF